VLTPRQLAWLVVFYGVAVTLPVTEDMMSAAYRGSREDYLEVRDGIIREFLRLDLITRLEGATDAGMFAARHGWVEVKR